MRLHTMSFNLFNIAIYSDLTNFDYWLIPNVECTSMRFVLLDLCSQPWGTRQVELSHSSIPEPHGVLCAFVDHV